MARGASSTAQSYIWRAGLCTTSHSTLRFTYPLLFLAPQISLEEKKHVPKSFNVHSVTSKKAAGCSSPLSWAAAPSTQVLVTPPLPKLLSCRCLMVLPTFQSSHVIVSWLILSTELQLICHFTSKSVTVIFRLHFSKERNISVPLPSLFLHEAG